MGFVLKVISKNSWVSESALWIVGVKSSRIVFGWIWLYVKPVSLASSSSLVSPFMIKPSSIKVRKILLHPFWLFLYRGQQIAEEFCLQVHLKFVAHGSKHKEKQAAFVYHSVVKHSCWSDIAHSVIIADIGVFFLSV